MGTISKEYICIFSKKDDPNVSYLCYTDNINKKLAEINSGLYKDKDFYSLYFKYAVTSAKEAEYIFDLIDSVNPDIRMEYNPNVFKVSPNKPRDILLKVFNLEEYLLSQAAESAQKNDGLKTRKASSGIDKKDAIRLISGSGYDFKNNNITFASKNSLLNYYWANPHKSVLDADWYLILNDYVNKTLHLFFIPCKTIDITEIPVRTDNQKPDCLKIHIVYDDEHFPNTPNKTKYIFSKNFMFFH